MSLLYAIVEQAIDGDYLGSGALSLTPTELAAWMLWLEYRRPTPPEAST